MDARHETGPTGSVTTTPLAEALAQGSEAVFNRHTPDTQAAMEAASGTGYPTGQAVPLDPVVAEANRQAVRRFVVTLVAAVDRRIEKALYVQAKPLGEEFAVEVSKTPAMEETDRDELGELAAVLAEKYGLNFKYATEAAAGFCVGGWLFGIAIAFKKTGQLLKAKEKPANN